MPQFGTIQDGVEYVLRPGGYAVVVDQGLVAIVKTPKGYFLPGGGAESGEALADTAIRETREETGLNITITNEVGTADEFVSSAKYEGHFQKVCTFFSARIISESYEGEADHKLVWTSPDKAIDILTHGSQKWAVAKHFSSTVHV